MSGSKFPRRAPGATFGNLMRCRAIPDDYQFLHNHQSVYIAASAWRKQLKHYRGRGASEFRADSAEMIISFVRFAKAESYQSGLATFLAAWRRNKAVPTVPEMAFSCLDEGWSRLCIVVKRQYWASDHLFETKF